MRKALALGTTAAALTLMAAVAAPASATDVTFTITGGSLSISQPATAALTGGDSGLLGQSVSGALGETTVTDQRNGITAWSTKIHGTDFTNGTTSIAVTSVKAFVPATPLMAVTGTVVPTQGLAVDALTGVALAVAPNGPTLVTTAGVLGNNTVTFTPHISIPIPADATAGTYSGTVTQTVS